MPGDPFLSSQRIYGAANRKPLQCYILLASSWLEGEECCSSCCQNSFGSQIAAATFRSERPRLQPRPPPPRSLSLFCLGALECFNSGMNINTAFGEICWGSAKPCLLQGAFKPAITVYHIRHKEFIVTLHKGGTHSPLCSNTTSIPSPASFPANTAFPRTLWMHSAV